MSYILAIGVSVLAVTLVTADVGDVLKKKPTCKMDYFHMKKFCGVWFVQGRYIPCSFSGQTEFTDSSFDVKLDDDGSFIEIGTWRNDGCMSVRTRMRPNKDEVGSFTNKDGFGNVKSGQMKIIHTDYKSYCMTWGCTKEAAFGGTCDDPWLTVSTRKRIPSAKTLKIIDYILDKVFGISFKSLRRIPQEMPCFEEKIQERAHKKYSVYK